MTEQEKVAKLLVIVEKLKIEYEILVNQGRLEEAEETKKLLISTIKNIKEKKEKLEAEFKKKNARNIQREEKKRKTLEKINEKENKKKRVKKFKTGTAIMFVLILIFTLIFCVGQGLLYQNMVNKTFVDRSTNYNGALHFFSKLFDVLILIIFVIFNLIERNLKKKKEYKLFIFLGLLLAYPTFGGIPILNITPTLLREGNGIAIFPAMFILTGLYYFSKNIFRK